jgi:hypothetical protein
MKLKLFTLSLLLLFLYPLVQDTKTELLCDKKWELQFIEVDELKVPVDVDQNLQMWMLFEKGGVQKTNTTQGLIEGKWEFTKEKDALLITNVKGDQKKFTLQKLDKESLVLILDDFEETGVLYFGLFK